MGDSSPAVVGLMRRILRHETGGAQDADSLAAAVATVREKLFAELVTLVGARGLAALSGRALSLAKREFNLLSTVSPGGDSDSALQGLQEALGGHTAEDAEAACVSLLSQPVQLLVGLVGDDLGLRPVRKVWPEIALAATHVERDE